jgi:hypothetical protein
MTQQIDMQQQIDIPQQIDMQQIDIPQQIDMQQIDMQQQIDKQQQKNMQQQIDIQRQNDRYRVKSTPKKNVVNFFKGDVMFGRASTCEIKKCGDYISKMCLKIILPVLPNDIKYKSNVVYHLIDNIVFAISGSIIIEYDSFTLKLLDNLYGQNTNPLVDNIIHYEIPIKDIFKGRTDYKPFCNDNYHGIIIKYLSNAVIDVSVRFANIYNIIENISDVDKTNDKHLYRNLLLDAQVLSVHGLLIPDYIYDNSVIKPIFIKDSLQNITHWRNSNLVIENSFTQDMEIPIIGHVKKIKNIILSIESIDNSAIQDIECFIVGNGKSSEWELRPKWKLPPKSEYRMTEITDFCTDNQIIYHNSLFHRNKCAYNLRILIRNIKQIKFKLNCLIETDNIFVYENGNGWLMYSLGNDFLDDKFIRFSNFRT